MGERSWARLTIGDTVSRAALAAALDTLGDVRLEECLEIEGDPPGLEPGLQLGEPTP